MRLRWRIIIIWECPGILKAYVASASVDNVEPLVCSERPQLFDSAGGGLVVPGAYLIAGDAVHSSDVRQQSEAEKQKRIAEVGHGECVRRPRSEFPRRKLWLEKSGS